MADERYFCGECQTYHTFREVDTGGRCLKTGVQCVYPEYSYNDGPDEEDFFDDDECLSDVD